MKRLSAITAILPFLFLGVPSIQAQGLRCTFDLGFASMSAVIPDQVGGCLTDPYRIANGNVVQETMGGLLSWNPADNLPEFTNGSQTWVLGPFGLQTRPNGQKFSYEAPETQVAGVVLTNKPSADVVGFLTAAINADGLNHPVSASVIFRAP